MLVALSSGATTTAAWAAVASNVAATKTRPQIRKFVISGYQPQV
jgi:hypothetical protein